MPTPTTPQTVTSANWFYIFQGQRQGPVTILVLQQLIGGGRLGFNDMVWRDGLAEWATAGSMPELSTIFARLNYAAPATDIGQDAGMRMLLPVGRSGWAIAAGYLGLLSFVIVPGPLALIISVIAIWDIRRDKNKHGMGRAIFGLVLGILGTVGVLFMVVALVLKK